MSQRLTPEEIRAYWQQQVTLHGDSSDASWSDRMAIELEIREIGARIADGDRVLDVGCGNGFSTVRYASTKRVTIRGLDYVPEMVAAATTRIRKSATSLQGSLSFAVGDARRLPEASDTYDKVIATRVLINLQSWEEQGGVLRECARVLRPGGTLLLSEATEQGWRRINALRVEWGLAPIPMPPFNLYVDEDRLVQAAGRELALVELVNFSSTYFVGTRLVKPLLAKILDTPIDVKDPKAEWNRLVAQLPSWGDYGTQKLFVFRKPGG